MTKILLSDRNIIINFDNLTPGELQILGNNLANNKLSNLTTFYQIKKLVEERFKDTQKKEEFFD